MKTAILLVSYGTRHGDKLERSVGGIQRYLQKKFRNYPIYRAFTNQRIIEQLWEESRIVVPTLGEAMIQMQSDGIEQVIVQPTYVVYGVEYEKLKDALDDYQEIFRVLKLGEPLLSMVEDYKACVHYVIEEWRVDKSEIIVIAGHGTKGYAQSAYAMLEYAFHSLGYTNGVVGTVNGYPDITDVIQKLHCLESKRIRIIPFMIVSGEHVYRKLVEGETSWVTRFRNIGFSVEVVDKGLGEIEGIQHIFAEHVKEAMES